MRKIMMTIATLVAINSANAQEVKYGVKTGMNAAYFNSTTKTKDAGIKYGFHLGAVAEIKVTNKISVQPEIHYSTQGLTFDGYEPFDHQKLIKEELVKVNGGIAKIDGGIDKINGGLTKVNAGIVATEAAGGDASKLKAQKAGLETQKAGLETQRGQVEGLKQQLNGLSTIKEAGVSGDAVWSYNYINVPIMVKYYVTDAFNIEVGPQISYLVSANYKSNFKLTADGNDIDLPEGPISEAVKEALGAKSVVTGNGHTRNDKDSLKSIDFGMSFGAGYNLTEQISVGLRYNLGMIDIKKDRKADDKDYTKNAVIQVSLGYFF